MNSKLQPASGYCLEAMAEKAWRFGLDVFPVLPEGIEWVYADGSRIGWDIKRCWICRVSDALCYRRFSDQQDWSAA